MNQEYNIIVWKSIYTQSKQICEQLREMMIYGKDRGHQCLQKTAIMNFLRRIECNLWAVKNLAYIAVTHMNGSTYLKLPVGLLLRSCISDSLWAIYMSQKDESCIKDILKNLRTDYVKALLEQFNVYKDRVEDFVIDESTVETSFTMGIENHFIDVLEINESYAEEKMPKQCSPWKVPSRQRLTLKKIHEELSKNERTATLAKNLYAYYKYFSQYEHFSNNGHGDSLVDFVNDHMSFYKAFIRLGEAMNICLKQ